MKPRLIIMDNREDASVLAAEQIAAALTGTICANGNASFMASGGSTPAHMFSVLSESDIDWQDITVGLVDERWVAPDHPASNERLVRQKLLKGRAAAATFLPMKTGAATPDDAVVDRSAAYAPACEPISCILLGMGSDGHTASWFPGAAGLEAAFDPEGAIVAAIDASNSPLAGDEPLRITLTSAPVCSAKTGILLLFGEDKRAVLDQALAGDERTFPVRRAIDGLGARLSIIWAP
ncbi:MAG: 6-phosphogluconolactonase [Hyphomonas sp.]